MVLSQWYVLMSSSSTEVTNDISFAITDVVRREGGETATNDPNDAGGRTQYGIAERSNPDAWKDGVVTEAEAREIYLKKYVILPKFNLVQDPTLMSQLIDFGV